MNFEHLIPLLDVQDIQKAIAFYRDALGFVVVDELVWNGRIEWVLLHAGQAMLMLAEGGPPSAPHTGPQRASLYQASYAGMLFFYLEDTQSLYTKLKAQGHHLSNVQYHGPRVREFCLQDPDGHILWFSPWSAHQSHGQHHYGHQA
jgi:catechol 2,3-dioxygenase-like lactoylglutathione lyase family enzyme